MKSILIRGLEPSLADQIKTQARSLGKSVNQYIKDIIKEKIEGEGGKKYTEIHHDLDHLFGRWSEEEFQQIQGKIDSERTIDPELWE
ncbi:MAG: antitoxin [Desulfosalsimonadaceae bacterium]|nr:antitoxin [Desulfosalsimonadaceae bacterium]